VIDSMTVTHLDFVVPKFEFSSRFDLKATLISLGMTEPFEPGVADFTAMDGIDDGVPWIERVLHKAYIMIDENGTQASAGTVMQLTLGVYDRFMALRPFLFVIRDIPTGTILFMGRVLDPSR
jgi:serpin B